MINIKGLDKAKVLLELYNNSHQQGLGQLTPKVDLTLEDCRKLLENQTYFDYLRGKVMKVDLSSDEEFEERLYDRDNGEGKAKAVVDSIRDNLAKRNKVVKIENKSTIEKDEDYKPKEYRSIGVGDKDKRRLLYPVEFESSFKWVGSFQEYNGSGGFPPRDWKFTLRGIDLETDEGVEFYGIGHEGFMEIFDVEPWFARKHDILFQGKQEFCVFDVYTGDDIPTYNEAKEVYNEFKGQNLTNEEITEKMIEWAKEQRSKKR